MIDAEMNGVNPPRGSVWAAKIIFCVTEKIGRLMDLIVLARQKQADHYMSHLVSISEVREYANKIMHKDPRQAQDLLAAADKAELESQTK